MAYSILGVILEEKYFTSTQGRKNQQAFKPDIANRLHHIAMSRYVFTGLPKCLPSEGGNFRSQQRPLKSKILKFLLAT